MRDNSDGLQQGLKELFELANSPSKFDEICPAVTSIKDLKNNYEEFQLIGSGGLKDVYQCLDVRTKRMVAYAVLKDSVHQSLGDVLVHEAWLTSSLRHPNIIKIHEVNLDDEGRPYYTMDLKSGRDLRDLVMDGGTNHEALIELFCKICDAVAYAHNEGVVHLDLKPENIQCDDYGEVLLCDWGLGKSIGHTTHESTTHLNLAAKTTLYGDVKGSPGYMAPEQINGKYAKNHLTDIYSLGHILYFLAVKDDAFHGKVDELLEMTQATPCVRVPPNCQPHVSNALGTIISRATQLHPSDRYQSVIDLRDDLKSYLNGYVIKADRQNLFKRLRSFIKRKKRVIGWSCFVLTLIIGITGYFSSSLLEQKEISQDALALSVDLSEQVSLIKQQEEKFLEVLSREPGIERFLIRSASDIIQQLYEDPSASVLESVEIARELLEKALTINPQLKRPVTLDFCNLLSFNLSEIRPSVVNEVIQGALELCGESQSTYVYGRKNRPSPDVLADFFQKNKELGLLNTQIAELILRYDIECRPDVTWRHNEAITKIIERNNFSRGVVNVNYRRETDTVYITAEKNFSSGMENKRTSRLGRSSMLSLLKAETIQINVKGRCRLLGFDNSNFKTLIFSSCGGIDNEGPILINGLEKVVVPARFKRKGLENIILSTSPNKLKFYYE